MIRIKIQYREALNAESCKAFDTIYYICHLDHDC